MESASKEQQPMQKQLTTARIRKTISTYSLLSQLTVLPGGGPCYMIRPKPSSIATCDPN